MSKNNDLKVELFKMFNYLQNGDEYMSLGPHISLISIWEHDYFISIIFKYKYLKTENYKVEKTRLFQGR